MNHTLTGAQLIAAWSIKLNVAWPRFFLAMLVVGCVLVASAWLDQKGSTKK
jgi:hypothetical protein